MLNRSAVLSRCSILPVYAPCRTCKSGVGCRNAALRPEAVRTMGLGFVGERVDFGSAAVAGLRRLLGRGMCNGIGEASLGDFECESLCRSTGPGEWEYAGDNGELRASSAKSSASTIS